MLQRTAAALAAGTLLAAASPATAKCSLGQLLELPVTMTGLRAIVTASINDKPARFIVDSGAFYSTMSGAAASDLGLSLYSAPEGFYMGGIGGRAEVQLTKVKTFTLGKFAVHNIEFIVGGTDVGHTGLLGQNVLRLADVEYDFTNGAIRLFRPHDCANTSLAYWTKPGEAYSTLPIDQDAQADFQTAATVLINGIKIKAVFDTGSPTTILTSEAAARAGVKPGGAGVTPAGMTGGLGRQVVNTWIGPFQGLKIGDEEIQKIHLRFGKVSDGSFDMLIGADFFLSHRVYVSNRMHRMFFTYNGGPVFDLSRKYAAASADKSVAALPADADASALARRGASLVSRNAAADAIPLLDRAIVLAPKDASYHVIRARAYGATRNKDRAMADLDQALTLAPDDADALMLRAELRLADKLSDDDDDKDKGGKDGKDSKEGKDVQDSRPASHLSDAVKTAVRKDLDAASAALGKADGRRHELAQLYEGIQAFGPAVHEYDLWIAAHPQDGDLPEGLNGRCWVRTLANTQLDLAIADCNRALRLRPHVADVLDSRGLAYLRAGDADKAITSYNEALKLQPDLAWSHYGRGIAELRKGQKQAGEADLAAAKKIDKDVADTARGYGITPP